MRICFGTVLVLFAVLPILAGQSSTPGAPTLTIILPEAVKSETVQMVHHMVGQFGGYGGYVRADTGVSQYEIRAEAEGQPAKAIKILVYAPGCKIDKFDLVFSGDEKRSEPFVCSYLPTTRLSGKIPPDLAQQENAGIVVTYMVYWSNEYFGIVDGAVSTFDLARVKPESDGTFAVDVTDFSSDLPMSRSRLPAALHLTIRNAKTWNHLAHGLQPEATEFVTETDELRIEPTYPAGMRFVPSPGWNL